MSTMYNQSQKSSVRLIVKFCVTGPRLRGTRSAPQQTELILHRDEVWYFCFGIFCFIWVKFCRMVELEQFGSK